MEGETPYLVTSVGALFLTLVQVTRMLLAEKDSKLKMLKDFFDLVKDK